MMRARHRLLSTGTTGKTFLGGILIVSGWLILFDLELRSRHSHASPFQSSLH
jgi:hypothetical protein